VRLARAYKRRVAIFTAEAEKKIPEGNTPDKQAVTLERRRAVLAEGAPPCCPVAPITAIRSLLLDNTFALLSSSIIQDLIAIDWVR